MSIANWSRQRIVGLWVVGGMLEFVIVFGPVALSQYMFTNNRETMQQIQVQEDRYKLADSVNKASVTAQRDTGKAVLNATGETRYPIVSDATPRLTEKDSQERARKLGIILIIVALSIYSIIPVFLVAITIKWRRATRIRLARLQT
ncbi:MAG: hypothetical protein ABJC26_06380 [Gemmatimonadaceae bacterium]